MTPTSDPTPEKPKNCLVVALGYFGRGSSVKEAATNCHKAGAGKRDCCCVVITDVELEFIDAFTVGYPNGTPTFQTDFHVNQLGSLL